MKLIGRFDMKMRQDFNAAVGQCIEKKTKELLIDLREVSFVDSSGIGMLIVTHKHCQASSIALRLCVSEGHVKQVIELMKIPSFIPMVSSV